MERKGQEESQGTGNAEGEQKQAGLAVGVGA